MSAEGGGKRYQNFVISIHRGEGGDYQVEARGPTGEAAATFALPFDDRDLKIFLLEIGYPRRTTTRGRVPEPVQRTVDFGQRLFDAAIGGEVRDLFASARHDAERCGYGLRLQLRLSRVPALANLPWEFLYDGRDFLALCEATPLVRYLDLPNPPRPMEVAPPLRILVTVSAPLGLPSLDVAAEEARVREALAPLTERGMLEFEVAPDATLYGLRRTMRRARSRGRPYHVWHYIGHGDFDRALGASVLAFCDRDNMYSPVGGFQLGTLLNGYPEMRLVLLNACEGARPDAEDPFAGVAAALVERGVPAVIGMQREISDEAAAVLAGEFYEALVDGLPVDAALTEARLAVFSLPNWVEWATPVLFMRAPDGRIFDVSAAVRPTELVATPPIETAVARPDELAVEEPSPSEAQAQLTCPACGAETQPGMRFCAACGASLTQPPVGPKLALEVEPEIVVEEALPLPFEPQTVIVPAGRFLMGTSKSELAKIARLGGDRDWIQDEAPQHAVHLKEYAIGRYPVTVAQFRAFVEDKGYGMRDYWTAAGWRTREREVWKQPRFWDDERWNDPAQPVVGVSWYEAMAYCRWLAARTGKPYRLPSEAEWEKAARGTDGRRYPWGDAWDPTRCNNKEHGPARTTPVGQFSPQGDSLYSAADMAGQVWEWCRSTYTGYAYEAGDGREDPEGDNRRVLRGGSWYSDNPATLCRCGCRYYELPSTRGTLWGFRCAMATSSVP